MKSFSLTTTAALSMSANTPIMRLAAEMPECVVDCPINDHERDSCDAICGFPFGGIGQFWGHGTNCHINERVDIFVRIASSIGDAPPPIQNRTANAGSSRFYVSRLVLGETASPRNTSVA